MNESRHRMIWLDEAAEMSQKQCWSLWEGCVCKHVKPHIEPHECDDPWCGTSWTTEQSDEWMAAERAAHAIGETVDDRHRVREI